MVHVDHLKHFSASDLAAILARAQEIKADPKAFRQALAQQSLAMLFQKTSTRTRVSFEVAMTELGGHALFLDWQSSNFVLTDLRYEIEYLSRNVDVIMARLLKNADFKIMTEASQVPMINGCCERYHPCQALTDVLTMTEFSDAGLVSVASIKWRIGVPMGAITFFGAISASPVNVTIRSVTGLPSIARDNSANVPGL